MDKNNIFKMLKELEYKKCPKDCTLCKSIAAGLPEVTDDFTSVMHRILPFRIIGESNKIILEIMEQCPLYEEILKKGITYYSIFCLLLEDAKTRELIVTEHSLCFPEFTDITWEPMASITEMTSKTVKES